MNRKIFSATMLVLMMLILAACTSTSLTRLWKDTAYNEKPIGSVMVLGVAKQNDVGQRFENLFVDAFQKKVSPLSPHTKLFRRADS